MINEQERKAMIRSTFNTVAGGYDNPAFSFFTKSAEHMTACLDLKGDEHVLDVATGTGVVALRLARRLTHGRVTAIDFSEGMLAQARMKAEAGSVRNIEFLEMDMQAVRFPDNYFDAATCAFGIFFAEDMENQLKHITGKIKEGGKVILSAFYEDSFLPMSELYINRIQKYGVERPSIPWKRISTEGKCASLLGNSGLIDVRVIIKDVGYYLKSIDEWWDVIWNGGFRRYLSPFSAHDLEKFRKEHLAEVAKLATENGIWMDVKVLYAIGTKPAVQSQ